MLSIQLIAEGFPYRHETDRDHSSVRHVNAQRSVPRFTAMANRDHPYCLTAYGVERQEVGRCTVADCAG